MKRERDYKAEYQKRIERGLRLGFTRSQARGHARIRKGEVALSFIQDVRRAIKSDSEAMRKRISDRMKAINLDPESWADLVEVQGVGSRHEAYTLVVSPTRIEAA